MQVDLDSRDLVGALSRLYYVWDQKPGLPKGSYLRISRSADEKHLRLSVYGTLMEAHALVPALISDAGVYATPLSVFMPLSKCLPDGRAKFVFKDGKGFLRVQTGLYQLALASDLTIFPESRPEEWDLKPLKMVPFLASLEQVSVCTQQAGRPYSDVVFVDDRDFAATDSYRVAISPNEAFQTDRPVHLTAECVKKLVKMLANSTGDCGITADEGSVYLKRGGLYVAARLSARTFPGFRSVVPHSGAASAVFSTFPLLQSLRRLVVVSGARTGGIMTFSFSGATLQIKVLGEANEVSTEELPFTGDVQGQVTLNGNYVVEALSVFKTDSIQLDYRGSKMPLVITDGANRHVLQPIG